MAMPHVAPVLPNVGPRPPRAYPLTDLRPLLDLTPDQRRDTGDVSLEQLQDSFGTVLVTGFGHMWTSLRAVEVVLDEFAATFEGTDPLKPSHRRRLTEVRDGLEELAEALELFDLEVEWREPDEDLLAQVRGTVPAMRHLMG